MLALGVDIGGTFTDLLLYDAAAGTMTALKVPSAPGREWLGLAAGLDRLGTPTDRLHYVVHGTTVATNAVIEGTAARSALVTTKGFRDLLEIGRGMRLTPGSLFETHFRRPPPLVDRNQRIELDERVAADGSVVRAPGKQALAALTRAVRFACSTPTRTRITSGSWPRPSAGRCPASRSLPRTWSRPSSASTSG
jgi:N-methylhydantoinase A